MKAKRKRTKSKEQAFADRLKALLLENEQAIADKWKALRLEKGQAFADRLKARRPEKAQAIADKWKALRREKDPWQALMHGIPFDGTRNYHASKNYRADGRGLRKREDEAHDTAPYAAPDRIPENHPQTIADLLHAVEVELDAIGPGPSGSSKARDLCDAHNLLVGVILRVDAGDIEGAGVLLFRLGGIMARIGIYDLVKPPAPPRHPLRDAVKCAWFELLDEKKRDPIFGEILARMVKRGVSKTGSGESAKLSVEGCEPITVSSLRRKRLPEWKREWSR